MPTYQFEALNDAGAAQKGSVTAASKEEAISKIQSKGFFPTKVREQKAKKGSDGKSGSGADKKSGGMNDIAIDFGVSNKQLCVFTRQLSTLQDAGLPLLRSLDVLEEQQKPGTLKKTLRNMTDSVAGGSSLSDSMAENPKAFDRLYVKMVAAGEMGGVLDVILQRLAEFLEKAEKLKAKIKSAMIYPTVVLTVAFLIVTGIMIFIVPKFIEMFDDFGVKMPFVTNALIEISKWMAGPVLGLILGEDKKEFYNADQMIPGFIIIAAVPFILFLAFKFGRKTKQGKFIIDRGMLLIPAIGNLISKSTIAKFTRTLGTLITAGVPILDAIRITSETAPNGVFEQALMDAHDSVKQGDTFAEPLRQAKVCDALVTNMIEIGEETGDLDKMLIKVADTYDEEVEIAVEGLVSIIEPCMVVVLGVIVGGIVVALFMPMIAIMESLT